MRSLVIKQPARITETQATQAVFDAVKRVMQDDNAKYRMKCGECASVSLDGFDVDVSDYGSGEFRVMVYYPNAHNPCAIAVCDTYDI